MKNYIIKLNSLLTFLILFSTLSANAINKDNVMKEAMDNPVSSEYLQDILVNNVSRDECSDSFMVYGSDPAGTVGACYDDGTGYYVFEWTGGCVATTIEYSGGSIDITANGFTEGFFFYGFEPGATETFVITFDSGSQGAGEATNDCATCEELGQVTCWDGSCADSFDECPEEGTCPDGEIIDCVDPTECWPANWVGDGFGDCEDEQYGANLTCYDCDGGDCPATDPGCNDDGGGGGDPTLPAPTSLNAVAGEGEINLSWNAPGLFDSSSNNESDNHLNKDNVMKEAMDNPVSSEYLQDILVNNVSRDECSDSFMVYGSDPAGTVGACYDDGTGYYVFEWTGGCVATTIEYSGGSIDITANGFTEGFFFYGFEPGATETFVITFDSGSQGAGEATNDCATCEELGQVTCWDGSCADSFDECPEEGTCPDGEIIDCVDPTECWPANWVGDGFGDCEDEQYGANLTCYDCDGGDCPATDPGCNDDGGGGGDNPPSSYNVYRDGLSIGSVNGSTTSYTDSNVETGIEYCYTVTAVYADGESTESNSSCATAESSVVLGDVNFDGLINVLDIVVIVNHILGSELLTGTAAEAADFNEDDQVNVLDVVQMVNVILGSGRADINTIDNIKLTMKNDHLFIAENGVAGIQLNVSGNFNNLRSDSYELFSDNGTIVVISLDGSDIIDNVFSFDGELIINDFIVSNWNGESVNATVISQPNAFTMNPAYPNPFNPTTTIVYEINTNDLVNISVYDVLGRNMETLVNNTKTLGSHSVIWNASNYSSGIYYVKMVSGDVSQMQKIVLMK